MNNQPYSGLLSGLLDQMPKRKVFISFHHKNDRSWCKEFISLFSADYDVFDDQSVADTDIQSNNPNYVDRRIREDFIKGSSITIVLCGEETWKRKHVDWEINSTLHLEHALLGIILPTASRNNNNSVTVPDRLHENIISQYAYYINWTNNPSIIKQSIEIAIQKSGDKSKIKNSASKMTLNKP